MEQRNLPFETIEDVPLLAGTRVIVRASLNVPLVNGAVRDDFRVAQACETVQYLQRAGARVIVLAHIGRKPQESLAPVHVAMEQCTRHTFMEQLIGTEVTAAVDALADGDVLLLENVRSDAREMQNDDMFARELAALGDMYVNDAFADSHREHASIVGIPKYLPAYAGLVFTREYVALSRAFTPKRPALFVLGGAKFETKLPLVERFVREYDQVFIGGAIANDIFKARGNEVGQSKVSTIDLTDSALLTHERIVVPSDVVVDGPAGRREVSIDGVSAEERILDVGPQTIEQLAPLVAAAQTIVWNGPLGNYEAGFGDATNAFAQLAAASEATTIIGGGDTIAAIEALGLYEQFTFVSTAGGAMLQFLETETLPGIEVLKVV